MLRGMALPAGWTTDALVDEVVRGPWSAPPVLPDTRVIAREGWRQVITPSLEKGGWNEVAWCAVEPADAEAVIDAAVAEYRALGCLFRWAVVPGSKPDDLADRLARRGFPRSEVQGMARDLSPIAAPLASGVRIERAKDEAAADEFTHVTASGWGMDAAPLTAPHRAMIAPTHRESFGLFLARAGSAAVGAAAWSRARRSAYQMGAVVLPEWRRRGIYPSLVAARLADAAARGLDLAITHARADTSAPILERLGFVTVCRFPIFAIPPR